MRCLFRSRPWSTTARRMPLSMCPIDKAKNGLRRVAVKAGIANGSRTEILSGLNEGQTVYLQP